VLMARYSDMKRLRTCTCEKRQGAAHTPRFRTVVGLFGSVSSERGSRHLKDDFRHFILSEETRGLKGEQVIAV
jgi:hypothetical protein